MVPLYEVNGVQYADCEKCGKRLEYGTFDINYVCDIQQDWCEECISDLRFCRNCGSFCAHEESFEWINDCPICPECVEYFEEMEL